MLNILTTFTNFFARNRVATYYSPFFSYRVSDAKVKEPNPYEMYYGQLAIPAVKVAIDKIVDRCSLIDFEVCKKGADGEVKVVQDKEIQNRIKRIFFEPNSDTQTSYREFWLSTILNLLATGKVLFKITENSISDKVDLIILFSGDVTEYYNPTQDKIEYINYNLNGKTKKLNYTEDSKNGIVYYVDSNDQDSKYLFITSNPLCKDTIIPPLAMFTSQAILLDELNKAAIAFAENSQNNTTVLSIKNDMMTQQQFDDTVNNVKAASGGKNAGKMVVLTGDVQLLTPPVNNGLPEWYEKTYNAKTEEIYQMLGTPLDTVDKGPGTYNNKRQANVTLITTVKTHAENIFNIINQYMFAIINDSKNSKTALKTANYFLKPDYSKIPEQKEIEKENRLQRIQLLNEILISQTLDEADTTLIKKEIIKLLEIQNEA